MGAFSVIFDPDKHLQNLRERLENAQEGVGDKLVSPLKQAFLDTVQHITTRVEAQAVAFKTDKMAKKHEKQPFSNKVTSNITESITDEEIRLEVIVTARGIAANEYGDSQNRPTGVIRQEALGLQIEVEQLLQDVIKEA